MKLTIACLAVALGCVPPVGATEAPVPCGTTAVELRERIRTIHMLPCGDPSEGDAAWWGLARQGRACADEFIALMADSLPTDLSVCLVGGQYTVGDVALLAVSEAVRGIPVLELITSRNDPRIDEIGFGVYWEYVRADPNHRVLLRDKVRTWWSEHGGALEWHDDASTPLGGYYSVTPHAAANPALQRPAAEPAAAER